MYVLRPVHRCLSRGLTRTLDLGALTRRPTGELLKGKDLKGASKVALLLLGLDEPSQLGAGLVNIYSSLVGVAVKKCQPFTSVRNRRVEVKDVHLPHDNLGLLGSASLEPLVLEHAGLSSLYTARYLFGKFLYLPFPLY